VLRQIDGESTSDARRALDGDLAVVCFDYLLNEIQSKAVAADLSIDHFLRSVKRFEYLTKIGGGDPDAFIFDRDLILPPPFSVVILIHFEPFAYFIELAIRF
jgi:hypothetical protein